MRLAVADSFNIRKRKLKKLGFTSYKDYLKSDLWRNLKKEVHSKKDCCDGCGSKNNLQVHHASYTFMTTRKVGKAKSLNLVCNECHKLIHKTAKNENIGLVGVTKKVLKPAQS